MAGVTQDLVTAAKRGSKPRRATEEALFARIILIGITLFFFVLFLAVPLIAVFAEALRKGWEAYLTTFTDPDCWYAIRLTLITAGVAVPLNTVFGVAAAWAISRFQFRGKQLLSILIDLPLWVSPVIGGLIYVLLFGSRGIFWSLLEANDLKIIYATPGIILATTFVTFPFVARNLIPLMQAQGVAEEEAAITLGARGWQVFRYVTLPKIKWGLIYGIILCNARAMGEFGAVSLVSGHIRGETNTVPLQIEILYNEYQSVAAFAMASILSILALITLGVKGFIEWRAAKQFAAAQR